jgi:hypothetical protein
MSSEVKPRLRGTDINKKLKMKINARRPQIASNVAPLNPWYIAGFTDGEGS